MTEIGNDLTVDGTVTARQASRAGEAVVLGSDGLIPANLLPATSGGAKYIYIGKTGGLAKNIAVAGAVQSSAESTMQIAKEDTTTFGLIKMHIVDGYVITSSGEGSYAWNTSLTNKEYYKIQAKNIPADVYESIVESLPGVQCIGNFAVTYSIKARRSNKTEVCKGVVKLQDGQVTMVSCQPSTSSTYVFGNSDGTFDFGFSIITETIEPLDR